MKQTHLLLAALLLFAGNVVGQDVNLHDSLIFYFKKQNFEKAISFSKQLVEENESKKNNDSALAISISDLAFLYKQKGDYDLAEKYFKKSRFLIKSYFGETHPEYANVLNNIAALYKNLGRYTEAKANLEKAVSIFKTKNKDNKTNEYLTVANNLANLYALLGNYYEAEKMQLDILAERMKRNPKTIDVALSLNGLAVTYYRLENYQDAEKYYRGAITIYEQLGEGENLDCTTIKSNLANVYLKTGKIKLADSLFKDVLVQRKKKLGENNEHYAQTLSSTSKVYLLIGNYEKAEQLIKEAVKIYKDKLGEDNDNYMDAYSNLGGLYFEMGKYDSARAIFTKIVKNDYIRSPINFLDQLNNLASLEDMMGNNLLSSIYYKEANDIQRKILMDNLYFLSENELANYIKQRTPSLTMHLSSLSNNVSASLLQSAYNNRLLLKGVTLQNTSSLYKQLEQSTDTSLATIYKAFKVNKAIINKQLTLPIAKRTINIDSLTELTNQQEKTLLRLSADYRDIKNKLNTTWQDVRNHLQPREAAIEFVKFNYFSKKETDTVYYAAMLVRPQDTVPIFIKLFEEGQLKAALKRFAYTASSTTRSNNNTPNSSAPQKNNLYGLVWQPLAPYLSDISTVYFAPDGLLHQLAFAAIPYKKDSLLCDKYKLVQVSSTRQVATKQVSNIAPSSIALFGGINYSRQQTDTSKPTIADPYAFVYQQNRSADKDSFTYLPNTLQEVVTIQQSMANQHKRVSYFTGDKATEAAFRSLGGSQSPQVIHFATHGFTIPDTTAKTSNNVFKTSDNPLLRTGLVMAGGNKGWQGKSSYNEDDGILTALEISNVALPNTQLAVLSACETANGELRGSEGVFGLQRAFKIAGVNYVMASLWQVPDKQTLEFMTQFYKQWLTGSSIQQAFLATQQLLRKKYPPYYWAGFTLVH